MTIRCKFRLEEVTHTVGGASTVKFRAVTSGSKENEQFYRWTPSGELTFSSVKTEAVAALTVGSEFYIDIVPADK